MPCPRLTSSPPRPPPLPPCPGASRADPHRRCGRQTSQQGPSDKARAVEVSAGTNSVRGVSVDAPPPANPFTERFGLIPGTSQYGYQIFIESDLSAAPYSNLPGRATPGRATPGTGAGGGPGSVVGMGMQRV